MRRLLVLPFFLLMSAAPPPTDAGRTILPEVIAVRMVGADHIYLIHRDAVTFAAVADLKSEAGPVNSFGFPDISIANDAPSVASKLMTSLGNPSDLKTTFWSAMDVIDKSTGKKTTVKIMHIVHTPCKGYSAAMCVKKHDAQVLAMMQNHKPVNP